MRLPLTLWPGLVRSLHLHRTRHHQRDARPPRQIPAHHTCIYTRQPIAAPWYLQRITTKCAHIPDGAISASVRCDAAGRQFMSSTATPSMCNRPRELCALTRTHTHTYIYIVPVVRVIFMWPDDYTGHNATQTKRAAPYTPRSQLTLYRLYCVCVFVKDARSWWNRGANTYTQCKSLSILYFGRARTLFCVRCACALIDEPIKMKLCLIKINNAYRIEKRYVLQTRIMDMAGGEVRARISTVRKMHNIVFTVSFPWFAARNARGLSEEWKMQSGELEIMMFDVQPARKHNTTKGVVCANILKSTFDTGPERAHIVILQSKNTNNLNAAGQYGMRAYGFFTMQYNRHAYVMTMMMMCRQYKWLFTISLKPNFRTITEPHKNGTRTNIASLCAYVR